jgi:type III pantothenate kinase
MVRARLKLEPLFVTPATAGIKLGYLTPHTLGADRMANCVAAYQAHPGALIVIDFGTATTFDYVSPEGEFVGGLIAPGLMTAGEALFSRTAQLPAVDILAGTRKMVAQDTVSAMTAGLFQGYLALTEGLIVRMKAEVGTDPLVVATGGLAWAIAPAMSLDLVGRVTVDLNLTLEGIRLIHLRHRGGLVSPGRAE